MPDRTFGKLEAGSQKFRVAGLDECFEFHGVLLIKGLVMYSIVSCLFGALFMPADSQTVQG